MMRAHLPADEATFRWRGLRRLMVDELQTIAPAKATAQGQA